MAQAHTDQLDFNSNTESYNENQSCLSSQASLQSVPSLTYRPQQNKLCFSGNTFSTCLKTFQGHNSYVSCLYLSGKFLYSGSSDSEIRAWSRNPFDSDVDCYKELMSSKVVATGKGSGVKSIVFLMDKLFSAHLDNKIRVWKISDHELLDQQVKYSCVATLPTLQDRITKILLPGNHVRIRRHKTCTWVHHVDAVSAIALSEDQSLLYSVSWDRTLKIWRTKDFKCLESITNAHDDAINALTLSKDGDVYTGSADRRIKVWRKSSGHKKHSLFATLEKHRTGINALALNSDGSELYSGACDRSILVWEKDNDNENHMVVKGALRGHTQSILCIVSISDLVISGSADKTIRIWRGIEKSYTCIVVLEGHEGPVKCLTATIDWKSEQSERLCFVYSGSMDCNIKVWQVNVPYLY